MYFQNRVSISIWRDSSSSISRTELDFSWWFDQKSSTHSRNQQLLKQLLIQLLKWSEKHDDLRFVDKSVEIIKQFQHFTERDGGGGGSRTRVLLSFHQGIYKLSRNIYVFSEHVGNRPPQSGTPPWVSLTRRRTAATEPRLYDTLNHVPGQPGWARPF